MIEEEPFCTMEAIECYMGRAIDFWVLKRYKAAENEINDALNTLEKLSKKIKKMIKDIKEQKEHPFTDWRTGEEFRNTEEFDMIFEEALIKTEEPFIKTEEIMLFVDRAMDLWVLKRYEKAETLMSNALNTLEELRTEIKAMRRDIKEQKEHPFPDWPDKSGLYEMEPFDFKKYAI